MNKKTNIINNSDFENEINKEWIYSVTGSPIQTIVEKNKFARIKQTESLMQALPSSVHSGVSGEIHFLVRGNTNVTVSINELNSNTTLWSSQLAVAFDEEVWSEKKVTFSLSKDLPQQLLSLRFHADWQTNEEDRYIDIDNVVMTLA